MIVEIKGRELTATYHQGRLYIPKPFRDMFGLKDNDILVIKIVEHSHSPKKRNPPNRDLEKITESGNLSQVSSNESRKAPPNSYTDYTKPFKLLDEDEEPLGTMMNSARSEFGIFPIFLICPTI